MDAEDFEPAVGFEQVFMISPESARTYTLADKGLAIDFDGGVLYFRANDAGG